MLMLIQAFWFLAVLVGLPFPIMMFVNVDRGRTEGTALARKLEELNKARDAASTDQQGTLSQDVRNDLQESFSYQRS
jgi:UMF1 family MFS transporter